MSARELPVPGCGRATLLTRTRVAQTPNEARPSGQGGAAIQAPPVHPVRVAWFAAPVRAAEVALPSPRAFQIFLDVLEVSF
jgi:hypothetical protein